jgi:hypothetical protein
MSQCAFGAACPPRAVLLAVSIAHCGSAIVVSNTQGTPGARVTFSRVANV